MSIVPLVSLFLVAAPLLAAQTAPPPAATLKTLDGKTYTSVKVIEVEADGIRIAHSAGIAKIPMTQLPEEMRNNLSQEAKQKGEMQMKIQASLRGEQERIATEKELAAAKAKTKGIWRPESMKLTVLEVRGDGVVARREVKDADQAALPVFIEGAMGKPKGQMWMARVIRDGTWRYESRTLPKYRITK